MAQTVQKLRIGELLVRQGVLTEAQVAKIVEEQRRVARPFGDLAERLFGVSPDSIEQAWIDQYVGMGTEIDLDRQRLDVHVLKVLNRRQAWQFRTMPLRYDAHELVAATSREHLKRAVNFAWRRIGDPVYFLIAKRPQLEEFLMDHYPWPAGMELPIAG
jgi:hypothetical protein